MEAYEMERETTFLSGDLKLSGLIHYQPGQPGPPDPSGPSDPWDQRKQKTGGTAVIVTHPHPLYGGNMQNPVVESVCRAFYKNGAATLRFDFRGVGKSDGAHDQGIGEQDDVLAAHTYLTHAGFATIALAGYSFGSWVNGHAALKQPAFSDIVMISPPVAMMDFSECPALPGLGLVATGSDDEIAPPKGVQQLLERCESRAAFEIIHGADHFYSGFMGALEGVVSNYLERASKDITSKDIKKR